MKDTRKQLPETSIEITNLNTYRDLVVYQKSKLLVKRVYNSSNKFPKQDYALQNQIQRAVISIPVNIAEGQERYSYKEAIRFLYIARASLAEVEVFADIAKDLEYISNDELSEIINLTSEVGKMINGLVKSLRSKATLSDN